VVNLNTASAEALSLLPGVGPSKAAAIVAYRRRRPFRTVDELVRIKGIGRKMVRRLRAHLAVAGPTTAAAAVVKPGAAAATAPPKPAPAPARPANATRCPPPRLVARTPRATSRDRWPERRPFSSPCLGAR
jgi:competence ComEA-like helix-hairpin-helix protein